jgi:MFS family permease
VGHDTADAGEATPAARPVPASASAERRAEGQRRDEQTPLGALGPRVNTHPEVLLALSAMSILKGLVGFLTFLLAFELKGSSSHNGAQWYGFMLAASMAGSIVGVLIVPRLRSLLAEPQLIAVAIWAVALAGVCAAFVGGIVIQALVAFVVGVAGAAAKPAFDALVQRYVPSAAQGRAFGRFETRLQLVWVLGALLPVVVHLPLGAGDTVIAATAAVAGLSYLTSRRALRHRWVAP